MISYRCAHGLHDGGPGGCEGWALLYQGHEIQPADLELGRVAGFHYEVCACVCHGPAPDPRASIMGEVAAP